MIDEAEENGKKPHTLQKRESYKKSNGFNFKTLSTEQH